MAIRKATSSGNWDGGATHPFDALPVDGDTIHTNGFTVTITGHINLPTATLTNAAGTGISAGGSFALSGSWDITVAAMTASTVTLLNITGTTTNTITVATCIGGTSSNARCILQGGTQTLAFVSCTFNGGSGGGATALLFQGVAATVSFSSCFCACGSSAVAYGVSCTTGTVTCIGSLSILQLATSAGEAISCGNVATTWTLTGSVTHRGSAITVYLPAGTMTYTVTSESIVGAIASVNAGYWTAAGSGVLTVNRASGILDLGNTGPALVQNAGANSRVTYTGDVICGNSAHGHAAYHSVGGGTGFIRMYGTIYGPSDVTVLTGARCAAGASVTVQHLARHPTNNTPPTMVGSVLRWTDSTNLTRTASGDLLLVPSSSVGDPPSQTNVRNGTSYHFGTMTGTLIVPSPSYVSTGVATDNTVGTLVAGMTALELRQALFHADDTANKLRVSDTGGVELNSGALDPVLEAVADVQASIDAGGSPVFTAVVVARIATGAAAGWPESLTIGDAYLSENAGAQPLFIKDVADNILSGLGTKNFADADFVATLRLAPLTDGTRTLDTPPTTIEVKSTDDVGIVYNDDTAGAEYFELQIPRAKTLMGVTKTKYSCQFIMNWGIDNTFERTVNLGEIKFLRKNAPAT